MYPQPELNQLAVRKAGLRRAIAVRRARCAQAAARVAQPLEWIDPMLAFWRRLPLLAQFAAVPLGLLVQRNGSPRWKILRTLIRWGPLVFRAGRLASHALTSAAESSHSSNGRFIRPPG